MLDVFDAYKFSQHNAHVAMVGGRNVRLLDVGYFLFVVSLTLVVILHAQWQSAFAILGVCSFVGKLFKKASSAGPETIECTDIDPVVPGPWSFRSFW